MTPNKTPWYELDWTAAQLAPLLASGAPLLPELEAARANPAALRGTIPVQYLLAGTGTLMADIQRIPQTTYSAYRRFSRDGDRGEYEAPYFNKRLRLAAAALRLFLGVEVPGVDLLRVVEDYLWDLCKETNWVLPAHENTAVDLFAAETAFCLAEVLALLPDRIGAEVRRRTLVEIDRRVLEPYLRIGPSMWWYLGGNNWNGVCNSSVAAAFLLAEPDPRRAAEGVAQALRGLKVFLRTAFEEDGSSNEGVGYWQYGLVNLVAFAEMLRARTGGALDLLATPRLRQIAAYPAKMQLHGALFASFSDCHETIDFNFGIIQRLAERTGELALFNLMAKPAEAAENWCMPMMLRTALWWDGSQKDAPEPLDAVLPGPGIAHLTGQTPAGRPYRLVIKAGHNAENHNQNDIASFILHVDGENLLVDPGAGLYNRAYFSDRRYENIFANSFGHSLPVIGGRLQQDGRQFEGRLLEAGLEQPKAAVVEFARAYDIPNLTSARRTVTFTQPGEVALADGFEFAAEPLPVEEALVTWSEVSASGPDAVVEGARHRLRLHIAEPAGAEFSVQALADECRANQRDEVLKRLTFKLPAAARAQAVVNIRIEPKE